MVPSRGGGGGHANGQKSGGSGGGAKAGAPRDAKEKKGGGGGAVGGAAGAKEVREAVSDFVTSRLQPRYKSGALTKEQFKSVWNKARDKVMDSAPPGVGVADFLTDKRKAKITELVDMFVAKLGNQG